MMLKIDTSLQVDSLPVPVKEFLSHYLSGNLRTYAIVVTNNDGNFQHMYGFDETNENPTNNDLMALIGSLEEVKFTLLAEFRKGAYGNED